MIRSRQPAGIKGRAAAVGYAVVEARERTGVTQPGERSADIRSRIAACLLMILAAECGAACITSPWLHVRTVRVSGLSALTPEEAQTTRLACRLPERTSWALVPIRGVIQRLRKLPWVASVEVGCGLPGNVAVEVIPRRAVASIDTGAEGWEIDSAGTPIRRLRPGVDLQAIRYTPSLDVIPGAPLSAGAVRGSLFVARFVATTNDIPRAKIEVDQNSDICLNMPDGVGIFLGQAEELEAKLETLRRIYSQAPDIASEVSAINLRCPESPACTPRKKVKGASKKDALPLEGSGSSVRLFPGTQSIRSHP